MRSRRALLNTVSSLMLELVTILVGLIVPRLILTNFGSQYNGITTSIAQFLTVISLLRSGAGGVTRAALYKPLSTNDTERISGIIRATEIFMRRIALIFLGIILIFACIYPIVVTDFGWFFTFLLVLILGIDSFFNYYFGISYQILLMADQREYIYSTIRIVSTIFTAIVSVVLIQLGSNIHIVKLGAAFSSLISPFMLYLYTRKYYKINANAKPDNTAIQQRWSAFVHQIANYVHGNASVMVLTIFSGDIKEVSVYAVYSMVISKIRTLVKSLTTGMEAIMGNMLAKDDKKAVIENFRLMESITFLSSDFFFGCTGALILSFVTVYTRGVIDVNYYRPLFAILFVLSEYIYCIRIPFISLVQSAGHYKQTKNSALIEAILNLLISIAFVFKFGLIGVALGNLTAMIYRTIYLIIYSYKIILQSNYFKIFIQSFVNVFITFFIMVIPAVIIDECTSYSDWLLFAVVCSSVIALIVLILATCIYRKELKSIIKHLKYALIKK